MTSNFKSDIDALAKHYGDLVKQHGDAAEGAQYAARASQEKRMEVLAEIGVAPKDALMVAAHAWDCHGAKAVGMRTAFVARGHPVPASMAKPDIIVDDLADLPAAILGA